MSKTKEELNALKEEVDNLNDKLKELTPEEIEQVTGGADSNIDTPDIRALKVHRLLTDLPGTEDNLM